MFGLAKILLASAIIASIAPSLVLAQSTNEGWTDPINLSHSGAARNPSFVMDSDGVGHAIWQDDLANYSYAEFAGDEWSPPKATSLNNLFDLSIEVSPTTIYTGPNPLLIAGTGEVFAFWLSDEGVLFRSKVANGSFGNIVAWGSKRNIAIDVASYSVAADALGDFHLVYLQSAEDSEGIAGIYYTRSRNSGAIWTAPVLLYESPYLHTLEPGEANLSITTTGTGDSLHVYAAWDNRPRKQVFLAQSDDAGKTWESPRLVAGPEPSSGASGPFNIHIGTHRQDVVVVWQNGRPGGACTQIYQSSTDDGGSWSDPQLMIADLSGCGVSNEFVRGVSMSADIPLYFITETNSQVLLSAWDGLRWTEAQVQPILSGFEEPEIFTPVLFACHRPTFFGQRLYIVGCDQGDGGDIWVTSRNLTSFEPPVWSLLSPVTNGNGKLQALQLVATEDGLFHAVFTQPEDPTVYYTYWDGEVWSRQTPVLALPDGENAWPTLVASAGNDLFLVARNDRGTMYFSRATSGNAATESRWATPKRLEVGHEGEIGSADVAWGPAGTIYVVYSVPVNDERGIYLVQSQDHGATWSQPLQLFDGAAAGFDLVGVPSLLLTEDGTVHVVWDRQSIQGDGVPGPLSLYYARSEDGGRSFGEAQEVVSEPVDWRAIIMDGNGNLHLLWQPQGTRTVWDQVSPDGGRTWQYPQGLLDEGRLAAVTQDSSGRLNLVGVGPSALGHWLWDGSRWQTEPSLAWTSAPSQENTVDLLAAAISQQGKMMVLLTKPTNEGEVTQLSLLYSTRNLDLQAESPGQTGPTQTLVAPTTIPVTQTPTEVSAPASTATVSPSTAQVQSEPANGQTSPLTAALMPVALVLASVLGLVIWRTVRKKNR